MVIFLILLSTARLSISNSSERFWISFRISQSAKYLMQIDALGNVILPATKISELGPTRTSFRTALSFNGTKALNFWFDSSERICRYVIDQNTLRTLQFVKTNLSSTDVTELSVTHRVKDNFISFSVATNEGIRLAAYPMDSDGRITGPAWFLSPELSQTCRRLGILCRAGVAPNGRLAYWGDVNTTKPREDDLFVRPLGPLGQPILKAVKIDQIFSQTALVSTFDGADGTNVLPGNKRFVVYIKAPPPPDQGFPPNTLILQQVDALSGHEIADPIVLLRTIDVAGNVRIDPEGRFVIFGSVAYLALDSTGHPSGKPRFLVKNNSAAGFDLLREVQD
jgi:hypothetical protein